MHRSTIVILALLLARTALALGPHEVALIANANSAASLRVARKYATLRAIPTANIINLKGITSPAPLAITPEDFNAKILTPINHTIRERDLSEQILVWVYSTDVPTTVSTKPAMSITGATFLRGRIPDDMTVVDKCTYESPIFADPHSPTAYSHMSRSLDSLKRIFAEDMPTPAFLLGYTGERGNTTAEVIEHLTRSVSADYTAPSGTIYFVTNDDVRSTARDWQFRSSARELRSIGVQATITSALPPKTAEVAGLMMGTANVKTKEAGSLIAGAFAEHLTSFAAAFDTDDQTKCTAWLAAGASASSGTVTEPYAAWPKFPHARIFVHYASGCTLIESFYQSVRSPLQILPIGDPLCQPWAPQARITITGLPRVASEPFTCKATVKYQNPAMSGHIRWLLDGRPAGAGDELTIDPSELSTGRHELRVISFLFGSIRCQSFSIMEFEVSRK